MNYIYGGTWFLAGWVVAMFVAGQPLASWVGVSVLVVAWAFIGVYLTGIHRGMRNNDL